MISPDTLPPAARRKLADLERQADDLLSLASTARAAAERAEAETHALLARREADPNRAAAIDAEAEGMKAEVARLREIQSHRLTRARNARQLLAQLRDFLERTPKSAMFEVVPTPRVEASVEELRAQIGELLAEGGRIFAAPLPKAELFERARALVNTLRTTGAPTIVIERGEFIVRFPEARDDVADRAAVLAWLLPDAMVNALHRDIEARTTKNAFVVGSKEREERLAAISAQVLELERQEEAALEDRADIDRRPEADALAILGIAPAVRRAAA
jgi:hypothetical protein